MTAFSISRTLVICLSCMLPSVWLGAADQSKPSPVSPGFDTTATRKMFDGWKAAVPPRHLIGNIYYVGAIGVSSYLITTPEGHILLDTGFDETVPVIENSVAELGFKVADIKFILSSHAHVDHVGGHARMKALTNATVVASEHDARTLASGGADDFIPLAAELARYTPVKADRIVRDGETIQLGGAVLTAHLTPGHTRGATTWTMQVPGSHRGLDIVFFSSASINPGVSLVLTPSYPEIVEDYEQTFARLRALPCDVFFAPHGGQFAMAEKFAKLDRNEGSPNPFIDPTGWRDLLDRAEKSFRDQLARERAAAK